MGYEEVDQVLESSRYQGPAKTVLVALAKHINSKRGDNEVWPGYARLIRVSGLSKNTVIRCLDKLVEDENPVVEIKKLGTGEESTRYLIHLDRLNLCILGEGSQGDSERVPGRGGVGIPGYPERVPNKEFELRSKKETGINNNNLAVVSSIYFSNSKNQIKDNSNPNSSVTSSPNPSTPSALLHPQDAPAPSAAAVEVAKYFFGVQEETEKVLAFARELEKVQKKVSAQALVFTIDYSRQGDFWPVRTVTPQGFLKCLANGALYKQAKRLYESKEKKSGMKFSYEKNVVDAGETRKFIRPVLEMQNVQAASVSLLTPKEAQRQADGQKVSVSCKHGVDHWMDCDTCGAGYRATFR